MVEKSSQRRAHLSKTSKILPQREPLSLFFIKSSLVIISHFIFNHLITFFIINIQESCLAAVASKRDLFSSAGCLLLFKNNSSNCKKSRLKKVPLMLSIFGLVLLKYSLTPLYMHTTFLIFWIILSYNFTFFNPLVTNFGHKVC